VLLAEISHGPLAESGLFSRPGLKYPKAITRFYNHLKMLINKFTDTLNQAKLFNQFCSNQRELCVCMGGPAAYGMGQP
jgi:hypothetical protein